MNRNFRMSRSIRPSEICSGPRCEFAVNSEISRRELKMFAMANRASATRVGCHMSQESRGFRALYWGKRKEGEVNTHADRVKFRSVVFSWAHLWHCLEGISFMKAVAGRSSNSQPMGHDPFWRLNGPFTGVRKHHQKKHIIKKQGYLHYDS